MMEELKFYLRLFMRRLPYMMVITAICAAISLVIAFRLPESFSSSASLLVETSTIPDRMVGVDLGVAASQQLALVQRSLLTRANLLEVARTTKAFPDLAQMTPDEIVTRMRENTSIGRGSGRRRGDGIQGMEIRFTNPDPERAAAVVNEYVTIVLATSSDVRTSRAQDTLDFFEQEVRRLTEDLDLQSKRIVEFKNANAQALPENLNYRLNRQSLLQERLSRNEREKTALSAQRETILRIYESAGSVPQINSAPLTPDQRNLELLERELNTALTIYSETNPRVRLLRSQIDGLRSKVDASAVVVDEDGTAVSALEVSLAEIDTQIETLDEDAVSIREELERLQDSIERTPPNRIALQAMEREMENLRSLYSSTVQRLNQARMGERVETSAQGDRIILLEPANVPDQPTNPNRLMIASAGFAVGLALSVGFFLLMELFNQSIRRAADIERKLDFTPLISLPIIETKAARRRRRLRKFAVFFGIVALFFGVLWAIDTFYMRIERLFQFLIEELL